MSGSGGHIRPNPAQQSVISGPAKVVPVTGPVARARTPASERSGGSASEAASCASYSASVKKLSIRFSFCSSSAEPGGAGGRCFRSTGASGAALPCPTVVSPVPAMVATGVGAGAGRVFSAPPALIGLNFNSFDLPIDLREKASSLFSDGAPTITRSDLIAEIWTQFDKLRSDDAFFSIYHAHSFILGKTIEFEENGQLISGTAK